jgi:unsaturated rhamnogalacturonyl hydrolase
MKIIFRAQILTLILCLFFAFPAISQEHDADISVLHSVCEHMLSHTSYDFKDPESGKVFQSLTEANYTPALEIRSPHNTWHYWNGVANIAMLKLGDYLKEPAYKEFVHRNYAFAFDNIEVLGNHRADNLHKWSFPFGQLLTIEELDDCGAMGGGLVETYRSVKRSEYKTYMDRAADHILHKQERLPDGTLVRSFPHKMTLWADDLYMSISFLARMGDLTGDPQYFNDAIRQVNNFTKYLYNEQTQLYYHCWYSDLKKNGVAHWGRCNGWVMMAQVDLLEYLPEDFPGREELLRILRQQILGVSRYQSESGLWFQLLDRNDSYLETSCTAMFTYGIAKAVNQGWIDSRYLSIAVRGWEGIKTKIRSDGQIEGICAGTGIQDDLIFYYKRPAPLNDIHGIGAVLLAGMEVIKSND